MLIDWIANEGVRVSAIVADLKVTVGSHPLIKPVLDAGPAAVAECRKKRRCRSTHRLMRTRLMGTEPYDLWFEQSGDATSLVVPLRIPVPL